MRRMAIATAVFVALLSIAVMLLRVRTWPSCMLVAISSSLSLIAVSTVVSAQVRLGHQWAVGLVSTSTAFTYIIIGGVLYQGDHPTIANILVALVFGALLGFAVVRHVMRIQERVVGECLLRDAIRCAGRGMILGVLQVGFIMLFAVPVLWLLLPTQRELHNRLVTSDLLKLMAGRVACLAMLGVCWLVTGALTGAIAGFHAASASTSR